ncbi:hypothetical protein AB3X94_09640 [Paraburkholderia sp. BR10923]|uniref:hypothetical protein n=1 Tax=Paraburkholderia sp. BR10923 TaxID=3236992 RepID=UPI0034CE0016
MTSRADEDWRPWPLARAELRRHQIDPVLLLIERHRFCAFLRWPVLRNRVVVRIVFMHDR